MMARVLLRALLTGALLLAASLLAVAQGEVADPSTDPVLRVEVSPESAVVGQPIVLRLTVLVPTFMPDPPVFPTFETPNVIVQLTEGSSGPVSERIDRETWSGVSRAYRLFPMIEGRFSIPGQPVTITYADPDGGEPVQTTLTTPDVTYSGIIPEAAAELDPFIAAASLTLEQSIEGVVEELSPGDAVTRTVAVTVEGVPATFIPELIPPLADARGLQAYPDEPRLEETSNRGRVTASRTEKVTYVAGSGGSFMLPDINLSWYNFDSETVETETAPGATINVVGPVVSEAPREPLNWRLVLIAAVLLVLAGVAVMALGKRLVPPVRAWIGRRREARLESEAHAAEQVRVALADNDLSALFPALVGWTERLPASSDPAEAAFSDALATLGAARFGTKPDGSGSTGLWSDLTKRFEAVRRVRLHVCELEQRTAGLPRLNPV